MSSSYTEDHLVEQPAVQLMQHELGWDVGGNIEHRTSNIERRSEEKRKMRTNPALQRLNPDLPVEAIDGAVEERGILNFECWILSGRGRLQVVPLLNPNSGGGGGLNALLDGFQYFWRFHRLVKLAILLKRHSIFTESEVSRTRERGDFVKIRPPVSLRAAAIWRCWFICGETSCFLQSFDFK